MNRIGFAVAIFFSAVLFSTSALSYGVVEGYVVEVRVERGGKVLISFDREIHGSPPACSAGRKTNMAFTTLDEGGEGMLSAALAAQASGNMLRGRGGGVCNVWSTIESAAYVVMIKDAPN
ncbi:hypothetical protein [Aliiglaciecola sp. M165]|uniref:hypothetical protein n=1 Tax=Aliiglaciecola sp. M165 TaxID=2593649 RepID=UPI0011809201|nr:hypothetical protein [Aliiglaciecola sp. M165]TRY33412.1 hypothetical protein FM019_05405 [Aliiglaciecola sp. M165]